MILNGIPSKDLLVDAYKFYSRKDARGHDALRIIKDRNDMQAAVDGCLSQALKEESVDKQKLYIQAACFGKKSHPGIAIDQYQSTCRELRVLNICRSKNIDYENGHDSIIDQLIARKEFSLALGLVKWLKKGGEKKVLIKWAEYVIERRDHLDNAVSNLIIEKFGRNPPVSYADIARIAANHHRISLAIKLIENEAQSSKQLPLLIEFHEYDRVLELALATRDSNSIYMTLFKLKNALRNEIPFFELLKKPKHKQAFKYYCNFLAATDLQKMTTVAFLNQMQDEILYNLLDNQLDSAIASSKRQKKDFIAQQIELSKRLNRFQQSLNDIAAPPKAHQKTWIGLSVSQTIINLVALDKGTRAKDCQKKFEVSDKKYRILEQIALDILPPLSAPVIEQ